MYTHNCDKRSFPLQKLLKICLRKFVFMHFKAVIQNSIHVSFLPFYFFCKIITTSISKLKNSGIFKKQNYESDMNNYWEKEERYWGKEICDFVPLITQHSQDPSLLSVI